LTGRHKSELVAKIAKGSSAALFLGLCGIALTLLLFGGHSFRPADRAGRPVGDSLPRYQSGHICPVRGDGSRLQ